MGSCRSGRGEGGLPLELGMVSRVYFISGKGFVLFPLRSCSALSPSIYPPF